MGPIKLGQPRSRCQISSFNPELAACSNHRAWSHQASVSRAVAQTLTNCPAPCILRRLRCLPILTCDTSRLYCSQSKRRELQSSRGDQRAGSPSCCGPLFRLIRLVLVRPINLHCSPPQLCCRAFLPPSSLSRTWTKSDTQYFAVLLPLTPPTFEPEASYCFPLLILLETSCCCPRGLVIQARPALVVLLLRFPSRDLAFGATHTAARTIQNGHHNQYHFLVYRRFCRLPAVQDLLVGCTVYRSLFDLTQISATRPSLL